MSNVNNSKTNIYDKKPATFVIFNKPGLSEKYYKQHPEDPRPMKPAHHSSKRQTTKHQKRSRKHHQRSRTEKRNKFEFDFSDLERLSLSDTEFEDKPIFVADRPSFTFKAIHSESMKSIHSVISEPKISTPQKLENKNKPKPSFNSRRPKPRTTQPVQSPMPSALTTKPRPRKIRNKPVQSPMYSALTTKQRPRKTRNNPVQKRAARKPKSRLNDDWMDILETSVSRQSSVNSMELLNRLHKITELKDQIPSNTEPKKDVLPPPLPEPQFVTKTFVKEQLGPMPNHHKNEEITPKVTEQTVMVTSIEETESLNEPKPAVIPVIEDIKEEIKETEPVNHAYPKSNLFQEQAQNDDVKQTEPVNHAYPKSDLFQLKGMANSAQSEPANNNPLSWAIPMGNPNKVKKVKVPARLTRPIGARKKKLQNGAKKFEKPIWR